MYFFRGFKDELLKTAAPGVGRIAKMIGRGEHKAEGGMHLGKKLLMGGAAAGVGAAGGAALGERHGKKKGYDEGTADVADVAERAREYGQEEGAEAFQQALRARLQAMGGGEKRE